MSQGVVGSLLRQLARGGDIPCHRVWQTAPARAAIIVGMDGENGKAMKALILAALPFAFAMPSALAEDTGATLQLRTKSAIATAVPHRWAPYVQPVGEPEREPLVSRRDLREDQSRSSCESDRALCYDPGSGRIVYKPARQYMPELPGLQPESISLRRNRIVFKYSF